MEKKENICKDCGTTRIDTPYYCIFCSAPGELHEIGAFGTQKDSAVFVNNVRSQFLWKSYSSGYKSVKNNRK